MIQLRKSEDRGHFDHGWLNTYHTFSFAEYRDPKFTGFRDLLVINEDRVAPGKGFGTHSHQDMEIITYIVSGALQHKDSMGNGSLIRQGDIQYMSAGKGVTHSEFNPSQTESVHLLQIWILPHTKKLDPRYAQLNFSDQDKYGRLKKVVSSDGAESSIAIRQDVNIYASLLDANNELKLPLQSHRYGWLQIVRGGVIVQATVLNAGDGAALQMESEITITAREQPTELLFFDFA